MILGHKIKDYVDTQEFINKIKSYDAENVQCTYHTFFRLSEKQREVFNCNTIREYLLERIPVMVGVQHDGAYAVFYKYGKQRFIRIIIDIKPHTVDVITFYIIEKNQLPVVK